ncbi:response regulator receiver protein [Desulfarculus baarsii DSM 2075]|uniref:Response regulator receiver protein n=1 Tax=Desulfarculus baarsii (strain ATCC 33931 / DSM 2075 / LMG 7858 / VKM B-1802 / 2st14) TaxID=644282 RepID=E1QDB6_DESB2|nr:response regulator [Desulfarculus baarsii]ADK83435.1 response regulator receiver protein [Desulfarculus baarsii DSM 2075]
MKIPIYILIVDDEPDFVDMLAMRLGDEGNKVRTALDGKSGLALLDEWDADVVILDIKMPGMDGMQVLKEIKQKHPIVEVILLTGHGTIDTAVEGLKSGAYDYLLKPANHQELLDKLEQARKRKAEHEERIRQAEALALVRRTGGM